MARPAKARPCASPWPPSEMPTEVLAISHPPLSRLHWSSRSHTHMPGGKDTGAMATPGCHNSNWPEGGKLASDGALRCEYRISDLDYPLDGPQQKNTFWTLLMYTLLGFFCVSLVQKGPKMKTKKKLGVRRVLLFFQNFFCKYQDEITTPKKFFKIFSS